MKLDDIAQGSFKGILTALPLKVANADYVSESFTGIKKYYIDGCSVGELEELVQAGFSLVHSILKGAYIEQVEDLKFFIVRDGSFVVTLYVGVNAFGVFPLVSKITADNDEHTLMRQLLIALGMKIELLALTTPTLHKKRQGIELLNAYEAVEALLQVFICSTLALQCSYTSCDDVTVYTNVNCMKDAVLQSDKELDDFVVSDDYCLLSGGKLSELKAIMLERIALVEQLSSTVFISGDLKLRVKAPTSFLLSVFN